MPTKGKQPVEPPFTCRPGCGACCIAPSISSPLPGLPQGKAAGARCPHLDDALRCSLFGQPERPSVCTGLQPSSQMCGSSATDALHYLTWLEQETRPA
jgi:Fe-S-cluster containining protein